MSKGGLKIATCQFAVSGSIKANSTRIQRYMQKAKDQNAEIVHFPETALSGYVGADFPTFDGYDWSLLESETEKIAALAKTLRIWVVLGSVHPIPGSEKPHNSLYLIDPEGKIVDRYDKRFCIKAELRRYTPGNRFVYFTINGVKCSLLICFDVRFPEIYRELKKADVQCIFQSFYNARQTGPSVHSHIMRQSMQCRAATNFFWVSMTNSSAPYSPYPSCFIEPDGKIAGQLKRNKPGLMVNSVDVAGRFYDPAGPYRHLAMKGKLTNAPESEDQG